LSELTDIYIETSNIFTQLTNGLVNVILLMEPWKAGGSIAVYDYSISAVSQVVALGGYKKESGQKRQSDRYAKRSGQGFTKLMLEEEEKLQGEITVSNFTYGANGRPAGINVRMRNYL